MLNKFFNIELPTNSIKIPVFVILSIILCLVLARGVELGIVTEEGYVNCREYLLQIDNGVYQNICSDHFRPDINIGE